MRRSDFKAYNIRSSKDQDVSRLWDEADQTFIDHMDCMLKQSKYYVCHVFTEDLSCQQRIHDKFEDEVRRGRVTMAPPANAPQSRSSLRSTSLRDSVKAFWAMSCCSLFLGTNGSNVTTYVANVNETFETQHVVGDYRVATQLTRAAFQGLRDCVEKNYEMLAMTTPETSRVNARQYGILHFLTDRHLQSIYSLVKKATWQAPVNIAMWNKSVLFEQLPWAKGNQIQFENADGEGSTRTPIINWFTAVIEIRLNPWVNSYTQDAMSILVIYIYIYSLPRLPPSSLYRHYLS